MTLDRFARLAAVHGGDLARWPVETRAPAAALASADPQAAATLAEAAALDAALAALAAEPPPAAPPGLLAACAAGAEGAAAARRRAARPLWAGLAAAALLGLGLGAALAPVDDAAEVVAVLDYATVDTLAWLEDDL